MSRDKDITALRALLFETLEGVKSGAMDLDRARAVNEISKTLVETARVEVDYLKTTGGQESGFMESPKEPALPGRTVHRIKG